MTTAAETAEKRAPLPKVNDVLRRIHEHLPRLVEGTVELEEAPRFMEKVRACLKDVAALVEGLDRGFAWPWVYACRECLCTTVEVTSWIEPNTGEIGNDGSPSDEGWCIGCGATGREGRNIGLFQADASDHFWKVPERGETDPAVYEAQIEALWVAGNKVAEETEEE